MIRTLRHLRLTRTHTLLRHLSSVPATSPAPQAQPPAPSAAAAPGTRTLATVDGLGVPIAPSRPPVFPAVRAPPLSSLLAPVSTRPPPPPFLTHCNHPFTLVHPAQAAAPRSGVAWSVGPPAVALMAAFSPRARLGAASEALFRSVEEQATQAAWWDALRLPRSWMAEHALLALHVWVLSTRLKVDYNVRPADFSGRRMQEELCERFWEDAARRIRNAGVVEMSVNKQLQRVQRVTLDDFRGYDEAMKTVGEDEGMELAAAVWRGVFREDEGADTAAVLALSDYALGEVLSVATQPREDVYKGWVTWSPAVGETLGARLARQRRMLEGEWRDALDGSGRLFFYHTVSQERRWDPPAEGFYPRRRFALTRYIEANPDKAPLLPPLPGAGAPPPAARLLQGSAQAAFKDLLKERAAGGAGGAAGGAGGAAGGAGGSGAQ